MTVVRFATQISLPTAPLLLPALDLQTPPVTTMVTVPLLLDLSPGSVIVSPPTQRRTVASNVPETAAQATESVVKAGPATACAPAPLILHTPLVPPVSRGTGDLTVLTYALVGSSTPAPTREPATPLPGVAAVTLAGVEITATSHAHRQPLVTLPLCAQVMVFVQVPMRTAIVTKVPL